MTNTNVGAELHIAVDGENNPVVQNSDLNLAAFQGLTWLKIAAVGNLGETGSNVNVLTYDTWDTKVTQKAPGITNAGDPELEVGFNPSDPGQTALRVASLPENRANNYAFKKVLQAGGARYYRGLVLGPRHPNGAPEDFDVEIFVLGLNQEEIVDYT